jgi:phosphatidylserine/phosphatidylglycerophosphate/cardiolipin synthase-like enzyme
VLSAQNEILLATYIFADDQFGNQLLSALKQKAAECVAVKICVDGYGSKEWFDKNIRL